MEVENISTLLDEIILEAIVPSKKVSIGAVYAADQLKGVIGTISALVTGSHAGMIGTTSPSTVDLLIGLIGTIFGTTNSAAGKPCMSKAAKVEGCILEAMQTKLYALKAM